VGRWPTSGRWTSGGFTHGAATKGANLGFASVFDEILARGSSIYRGFGSMISCACRTPSPIPPTRLGFDFDRISLGFFGWGRKTAPGPCGGGERKRKGGPGWALPRRKEKKKRKK
jgi:hypothetical protein